METSQTKSSMRRELVLIRLTASGTDQDRALGLIGQLSGRLLQLDSLQFTAELVGDPDRLSLLIDDLSDCGEVDFRRSGVLDLELVGAAR